MSHPYVVYSTLGLPSPCDICAYTLVLRQVTEDNKAPKFRAEIVVIPGQMLPIVLKDDKYSSLVLL
jgi:hypothetical protein